MFSDGFEHLGVMREPVDQEPPLGKLEGGQREIQAPGTTKATQKNPPDERGAEESKPPRPCGPPPHELSSPCSNAPPGPV